MMEAATTTHPKKNQNLSLTFFFPYRDISGVPVLFLRMAEFISTHYGIETCVIDYRDGYMARTIRERNSIVPVRFFEDGVPMITGPDTILVLQSLLPSTMRTELMIQSKTRIIFWTLHPMNLVQTIIPLPFFRHIQVRYILFHKLFMNTLVLSLKWKLQGLVKSMNMKRSIFFMDGSTLRFTQDRIDVRIDHPIFIPVPCDDVSQNIKISRLKKDKAFLSFCWVGRIADFKTHILIYTIRRLSYLARQKKIAIRFHIIGEGPDDPIIHALNVNNNYFQILYEGVVAGKVLDQFLFDYIDVLTAMGTSALECAKLGIPTILLDASYGKVKGDYKFRWLFESEDYGLGDLIDESHFASWNDSLERMIEDVQSNYEDLSLRTFEYYVNNHSISTVCKKFIVALENASFRYEDFNPDILQRGCIRRTYEYYRKIRKKFN